MKPIFTNIHIVSVFSRQGDIEIAKGQAAYMKNKFEFFGITAPDRRAIQRPFLLRKNLPQKAEAFALVEQLWKAPQRELQYFAMELVDKYRKQYEKGDIELLENMITHKSWWDTVDFLASNPVGIYLKKFPEEQDGLIDKWLKSDHLWLQRSCLLFQLKYKEELDTDLLEEIIVQLHGTKEFFINKAIGWILREYSKTNPEWVIDYVSKLELHPLSKREALKVINR